MKRSTCLRVLAFAALISAVVCMAAEAQQQRGGQRGQRGGGEGQPGPGGGGFGQRGPGGFGGRGPGMMGGGLLGLLRNEQVQEAVKITEDQKSKLTAIGEAQMAEMREQFAGRQGENREELSEADRQARREEFMKEMAERAKKVEGKVREALEPTQFKRLKEIELQQQMQNQGPAAFARPDIVQALGLTEEQQTSLKTIADGLEAESQQVREKTMQLFQGARDATEDERAKMREEGEKLREKAEATRKEAQQKAMAVLTEEQKGKLKNLMGEFVKIEMQRGFGGPRPGGTPGGQGGGRRPGGEGGRPARPQA